MDELDLDADRSGTESEYCCRRDEGPLGHPGGGVGTSLGRAFAVVRHVGGSSSARDKLK